MWTRLENILGLPHTKSKIRLIKTASLDCFISTTRPLEIARTIVLFTSVERRLIR
jgi:hypothetical protein